MESRIKNPKKPPAVKHPGEILQREFMAPHRIESASSLALALRVTRERISDLINGRRGVTAETSLRLSRLFGTDDRFWLDLQSEFELSQAKKVWENKIEQEIQPLEEKPRCKFNPSMRNINPSTKPVSCETELTELRRGRSNSSELEIFEPGVLEAESKLTDKEKRVYALLSDESTQFEVLFSNSELEIGELSACLVVLELAGLLKRQVGNYYTKCFDAN